VTRSRDLVGEYIGALRRMTLDDARALMAEGVPLRAITLVCPVPARVTVESGLFWPDPDGRPAWVVPAAAVDPADPERIETDDPANAISLGPIVDLVAFSPAAPGRWALRHGSAAVLGAIGPQCLDPPPVRVHRDVSAWLRAACEGLVLLTRDACEAGRILRQIETIEAEDRAHAAELRRQIERPPHISTRIVTPRAGGWRTAA
jgi:hypothetical protein